MLDNVGLRYPHRASGAKPLALCDRCPCFGSLFPPLAALTFAASSIICAFGLASAAPRSPYRHLELCGIALYSTVKRKRKYFAKINTLQSPRCTGGGIAVRGGRAGLSVCTGSIDYFCFRPDGYAGAGCQPERPGRIQRGRAGAAGHCGGSGFYCAAAVVAAARHPAANAVSAHSAARPLEPGVLPGGVFGAGQRGQPCSAGCWPVGWALPPAAPRCPPVAWICSFVISVCV